MKRFLLVLLVFPWLSCLSKPPGGSTTVDLSILGVCHPGEDVKTIVIPIRRVQNLIIIEARIDTLIGNFILDTGSPILVLNKTYFRKGWEMDSKTANATSVAAGPVMRTSVNQFSITDLYFQNIPADISDLSHIENSRGIKILGLLGVSLFTSYEMVIDFYKGELYLNKPEAGDVLPEITRLKTMEPIFKVPFSLSRNIILVDVVIAGKTLVFCVDTGAEINALSNLLPNKTLRGFKVTKRVVMLGMGGTQSEVLLGALDEFSVGTKSFPNMPVAITRLEDLSAAYGRTIHGILGNNFLVKGIISFNFITKELALYPFDVRKP